MKKILSNYRYYVLVILAITVMLGIFAVPAENLPFANWLYTLVFVKVIGFSAYYAAYRLVKRWEKQGTIPELIEYINNY